MKDKKKITITLVLTLVLVIAIVGISYAAFTYAGIGKKENTITTGVLTMTYIEDTNTISMSNALPTTDATGKKRLTKGEYFDFTVSGTVKGSENINWEIAAEDVTTATKKIDGSLIKLYLTSINEDGTETEVMAPKTYKNETSANETTGRPNNMMSLATGTTNASFSTKYRLRMYVDESYNPQGDGGGLSFTVKVNVYGKTGIKSTGGTTTSTGATTLIAKANPETLDYATATPEQKNQMWAFPHEATEQLAATTDYRYIGADPNNYVKFNDELWRIIGVFDVDDGTGKLEKRMKIRRNESIGSYSFDYSTTESSQGTSNWLIASLNYLLNPGHESETYGGSLYWNRKSGTCYDGEEKVTKACNFTSTGLTDEAKAMIGDAKWYLGGTWGAYYDVEDGFASDLYKTERGTAVYDSSSSTNWTGKVGLMYPSDYGYATSGGSSKNRASCMARQVYRWHYDDYNDCKDNDWLYNSSQVQWTITPRIDDHSLIDVIDYNGGSLISSGAIDSTIVVNPVVHLKSTIKITGGTGSSTDPFILSGN